VCRFCFFSMFPRRSLTDVTGANSIVPLCGDGGRARGNLKNGSRNSAHHQRDHRVRLSSSQQFFLFRLRRCCRVGRCRPAFSTPLALLALGHTSCTSRSCSHPGRRSHRTYRRPGERGEVAPRHGQRRQAGPGPCSPAWRCPRGRTMTGLCSYSQVSRGAAQRADDAARGSF
jgi:hypothetical protein